MLLRHIHLMSAGIFEDHSILICTLTILMGVNPEGSLKLRIVHLF